MIIGNDLTIEQKLEILSDAAKYDVACTSSGSERGGRKGQTGNTVKAGICHAFATDGRCISLLKILMTNECVFHCKYCINRAENDVVRASFTPEEVARLTMGFYRRNYIEGLFLSSGIYPDPETAALRMLQTAFLLRKEYGFNGYIHIKTIPGAPDDVIRKIGWLADRMSINLEFPTADGLKKLAPNKSRKSILTPMRMIQNGICMDQICDQKRLGNMGITNGAPLYHNRNVSTGLSYNNRNLIVSDAQLESFMIGRLEASPGRFVPAGQSTQMIIGATGESDYQIMSVTQELYNKFDLKRVFYSSFINVNNDSDMPQWQGRTIMDREHRLYQADFLLRFYGFTASELLSAERPDFNMLVDPKCDFALRHLELFPVEVSTASYYTLLKVPGIGVKSAQKIVAARRGGRLDFEHLAKMGVVMKRAVYFITCSGKMMYRINLNENNLLKYLVDDKKRFLIEDGVQYEQLSLFDFGMKPEDNYSSIACGI